MNTQKIYIDEEWVVQEYMKQEKNDSWDAAETQQDELVALLELELYAEDGGVRVNELHLDDIEQVVEDGEDESEPDAGEPMGPVLHVPDSDPPVSDRDPDSDDSDDDRDS
jgi:hypothetical protein